MIAILFLLTLYCPAYLMQDTLDEDEPWITNLYYPGNYQIDYGSILFPRDEDSGCICREYIKKYQTCFDMIRCTKFPRNTTVNLSTLKITATAIEHIRKGDMENILHITTLLIEANNELNRIEAGTFQNMSRLSNLSISHNPKLVSLEVGVFNGLTNLLELRLAKNGFVSTKDFTPALNARAMPRLYKLNLVELKCINVGKDDFINMGGSSLLEFNFVESHVEYIHPEAFVPLQNMSVLSLGGNDMNVTVIIDLVKKLIESNVPLKILSLTELGFRHMVPRYLLEIIANSGISGLHLSKNQFYKIDDDSFPPMPNLEYLDLGESSIRNITSNAFSQMPNLRNLLLYKNKLSFIPDGILLSNMTDLDISDNSGSSVSYFTFEKYKLVNMTQLRRLDLSKSNLRKIPFGAFDGAPNLDALFFTDSSVYLIDDGAFSPLKKLVYLSLERNKFPTRNFNKNIFFGLVSLEVLLIGFCGIKSFPGDTSFFEYLPALKHLDLQGNELKALSPVMTQPLQYLSTINLANNLIISWEQRMFTQNKFLKFVIAYGNYFEYLTEAMLEDISSLKQLDFSSNPFNCNCDSFKALQNFASLDEVEKVLRLIHHRSTYCAYPEKYTNLTIVNYYDMVQSEKICT